MLAYKALEDSYCEDYKQKGTKRALADQTRYNHTLIEKCVTLFCRKRTHCNVLDFDMKYLQDEKMKQIMVKMCKPEIKMEKKTVQNDRNMVMQ